MAEPLLDEEIALLRKPNPVHTDPQALVGLRGFLVLNQRFIATIDRERELREKAEAVARDTLKAHAQADTDRMHAEADAAAMREAIERLLGVCSKVHFARDWLQPALASDAGAKLLERVKALEGLEAAVRKYVVREMAAQHATVRMFDEELAALDELR